jgi:sortase A
MNQIRTSPRPLTALTVCLLAVGLWQVGEGSWIYAKARLAQYLLQRAWSRTLAGEAHVKPWPWADTWPIARLVVASRDIDLIVLEGAYGRTLAFGPGHVEAEGRMENQRTIVLTGHRDTHFRFLEHVQPNDMILLQTRTGAWRQFAVLDRRIVDARTTSISTDQEGTTLVFVTCYPFDTVVPGGPLRYVVQAAASSPGSPVDGLMSRRMH